MKYVFLALLVTVLGGIIVYSNTKKELVDVKSNASALPTASPSPTPSPVQTEEAAP